MDYALLALIAACVAGGILGAVVRAWSIHSKLYSLEDRLLVLEGVQQREVKIRASDARWKKPTKDEQLVLNALENPVPPQRPVNWWEAPHLKRGAHGV